MFDIEEVLESPGFWILGGGGVAAIVLGYTWGRNQGWEVMPFWQLIVMIIGTLLAAAYFATKE